jgi:hypothetical protein
MDERMQPGSPVALATEAKWKTRELLSWLAAVAGLGALWFYLSKLPGNCSHLQASTAFAGESSRFQTFLYEQYADGRSCSISSVGPARVPFIVSTVLAVVFGLVMWAALRRWWLRGWLSADLREMRAAVSLLPLVAAGLNVLENVVALVGFSYSERIKTTASGNFGGLQLARWAARLEPVFAWPKAIAAVLSAALLVATMFAALSRRSLPRATPAPGVSETPSAIEGLGICCSGGGIRAASISLGVLSALERHDGMSQPMPDDQLNGTRSILDRSRYLASVSGGGYAAGAWRIARGAGPSTGANQGPLDPVLWPTGVIGDPDDYADLPLPSLDYDSETTGGTPSLFRHLQARREFLGTGRGGFPGSLLVAALFVAVNIAVLAALVVAVAWPSGRQTRTWYVFGGASCESAQAVHSDGTVCGRLASKPEAEQRQCIEAIEPDRVIDSFPITRWPDFGRAINRTRCFLAADGQQMSIRWGLWGPGVALGSLAMVAYVARLALWRTARRRRLTNLGHSLAAASLYSAFVLLVVPLTLDVVYPFFSHHGILSSFGAIGALGGVGGLAAQLVRKQISRRLIYLGGVVLLLVVAAFSIIVAGQAATGRGIFALPQVYAYPIVAVGLLGLYAWLNPRWWSLHTLYRNRLRGAFAVTRDPNLVPAALRRPRLLTTLQPDGTVTSVPEPDNRRLWPLRQDAEPTVADYADAPGPMHLVCCSAARTQRTATGVKALSFVFAPDAVTLYEPYYDVDGLGVRSYSGTAQAYVRSLGSDRHAEGTESAAIAMSGAAFAPSMGRFNLGTTNALLAALNLRLGVWMPNPRYLTNDADRFPQSRLSHLVKELFGRFSLDDHHLYITDGGHRENLGLVELLRRRCKTIVCVDASGDTPGSFTTLRQASALARTEAAAFLDLSVLPRSLDMPDEPYVVIPVRYDESLGGEADDGKPADAHIIHLRPVLYSRLPSVLLAFGAEDAMFPHYSTGDQFLTEPQFRRLVEFGKDSATLALRDIDVSTAIAVALGEDASVPADLGA